MGRRKYQHDCDNCEFIFSTIRNGQPLDVYKSCEGSLLVRWGDNEPDYDCSPLEYVLRSLVNSGCTSHLTFVFRMLLDIREITLRADWVRYE